MIIQSLGSYITKEQTMIGSFIALMAYAYGLISTPLFWVLIILCALDFIIGLWAAIVNSEVDWDKCLYGIANKLFIGVIIILSILIDFTLMYFGINTAGIFHNFIMATLIARELGSINKNAEKAGFWLPKLFKVVVNKLREFARGDKK